MPVSDEEFGRSTDDASLVAAKADDAIRDLQRQLDVVKAQSDASEITAEQTHSLLEQKFVALSSDFSNLESQNAQLSASLEQRLSDLAEAPAEKHQLHLDTISLDGDVERLKLEAAEDQKSKRQLLEHVEQKNIEISEENATIKSYLDKIVFPEIIEIDEVGESLGVGEEDNTGMKQKAKLEYGYKWTVQIEEVTEDHTHFGLATGSSTDLSLSLTSVSHDLSCFISDSMDVDEGDLEYIYNDGNDIGDDDDFYYDDDDDGYSQSLDVQFDAQNLPPGVEATVPWLQVPASSSTFQYQPFTSKQLEEKDGEILKKFKDFKHFDTVSDYSDHYFLDPNKLCKRNYSSDSVISGKDSPQGGSLTKKMQKEWSKKIQDEWKILEKHLPDSIFVRVYEERIDLMRAVIVGPAGTPYHDGLFFFDIIFPSDYPNQPPKVYYHSGGLRLNPNLYEDGTVCLSLLNTWGGTKNEMWTSGKSTMLQVLVSIQGLVLNAKPYFNEPGYEKSAGKPEGEKRALAFNEDTFILSCKTMLYTLRKPPKHFEDFIVGHFRQRAHAILESCKAYMEGDQVGSVVVVHDANQGPESPVNVMEQDTSRGRESCSSKFKTQLDQMFPALLVAFSDNGADCRKFLPEKPVNVMEEDTSRGRESCSSKFKTQLDQMFPALLVAFSDNGADCQKFLPEKPDTTLKL